jgi:hypothetical protein
MHDMVVQHVTVMAALSQQHIARTWQVPIEPLESERLRWDALVKEVSTTQGDPVKTRELREKLQAILLPLIGQALQASQEGAFR